MAIQRKEPFGRPTLYKPEYCEQIVEFGKRGETFVCFAAEIGVCRDTISEWAAKYQDFSLALKQAKICAETYFIRLGTKACGGDQTLNFTAIKFFLAAAHGWRDKDTAVTNIIVGDQKKDVSFPTLDEPPA